MSSTTTSSPPSSTATAAEQRDGMVIIFHIIIYSISNSFALHIIQWGSRIWDYCYSEYCAFANATISPLQMIASHAADQEASIYPWFSHLRHHHHQHHPAHAAASSSTSTYAAAVAAALVVVERNYFCSMFLQSVDVASSSSYFSALSCTRILVLLLLL